MITRRILLLSVSTLAMTGGLAAAPVAVSLHKSPECGCCDLYADYLRERGFTVTSHSTREVAEISRKAGVPAELQGCHTAFVGGYVVEGHVPVEAIQKLLAERPAIKGITLAGMPVGSPGMPGPKAEPFVIHAFGEDGKSSVYMSL